MTALYVLLTVCVHAYIIYYIYVACESFQLLCVVVRQEEDDDDIAFAY